eukprot:m.274760 g.274760  ORF g.274760 m.274760 type:complete len:243 (+) comp40589_c0_seq2:426-1154(+)
MAEKEEEDGDSVQSSRQKSFTSKEMEREGASVGSLHEKADEVNVTSKMAASEAVDDRQLSMVENQNEDHALDAKFVGNDSVESCESKPTEKTAVGEEEMISSLGAEMEGIQDGVGSAVEAEADQMAGEKAAEVEVAPVEKVGEVDLPEGEEKEAEDESGRREVLSTLPPSKMSPIIPSENESVAERPAVDILVEADLKDLKKLEDVSEHEPALDLQIEEDQAEPEGSQGFTEFEPAAIVKKK